MHEFTFLLIAGLVVLHNIFLYKLTTLKQQTILDQLTKIEIKLVTLRGVQPVKIL